MVRGGGRLSAALGGSRPGDGCRNQVAGPARGIRYPPPPYHSTELNTFLARFGAKTAFSGPNSVEWYAAAGGSGGRGSVRVK
ncbi:hypothetical protein E3T55_18085 [Cryobacterium frigoriphilum]|uniref:Uncharacterized protein n=1 Tax=Cryobacterium frigoriphilum TaxID=1259150 RepID=A0A4R8ZU00_9MICO|nr:hypothetical protein [Cryobacterium frigoriphilum]TFD45772.1 hypothetical protein E3T55_18085 [Cryobacterium frigoriphilum]